MPDKTTSSRDKTVRLKRLLRLVTLLQSPRTYSPTELAAELGITRRTLFRDLKILTQAGLPCYYNEERGGYQMGDGVFLPPMNLTLTEALSLMLVAEHAGGEAGLPLQKAADDAVLKIASALPNHIRDHCAPSLRHTSVHLPAHATHDDLDDTFELLQSAIRAQRKVTFAYQSPVEAPAETILAPYHLHFSQRAWYVIGHSEHHDETRIFKLARIQRIEKLAQRYILEEPFRIESYLGDAWSLIPEGKTYHIRLRFAPLVARNVTEVLWHRTQQCTFEDDGSLIFEAYVDGIGEISWWILGYGDQVEVLGPQPLRDLITQRVRNLTQKYQDNNPEEL